MPELPEVETVARGLDRYIPGRIVERTVVRRRDILRRISLPASRLIGVEILRVERVGKNVVVRCGAGLSMVVNLGMTGRLLFSETGRFPAEYSGRHLHLRICFKPGGELRYHDPRRFGSILITGHDDIAGLLGLGEDPFQMRTQSFRTLLSRRRAAVKSILLNQKFISGMGNIYIDEALFYAGIHPAAPGERAARRARELLMAARTVLRRAIRSGGTTVRDFRSADGSNGYFQHKLAVYGRDGESCLRCGSVIRKIRVSGRGTHFCPACQPLDSKKPE
jgi:formamidopyrimidine-DNA glycosylase